jgi:hypothetical protein
MPKPISVQEAAHDAELQRIAWDKVKRARRRAIKRAKRLEKPAKPTSPLPSSEEDAKAEAIRAATARGDHSLARDLERDD